MKRSYTFVVATMSVVLSSQVLAVAAPSIDTQQMRANTLAESVLPPGAKIVAGNPAKNEFFILGQNETVHARVTADRDSPRMQSTADDSTSSDSIDGSASQPPEVQEITTESPATAASTPQPVMQSAAAEQALKSIATVKTESDVAATTPAKSVANKSNKPRMLVVERKTKTKAQIASSIKMALAHQPRLHAKKTINVVPTNVAAKKVVKQMASKQIKQKSVTIIVTRTSLHHTQYLTGTAAKSLMAAKAPVSKAALQRAGTKSAAMSVRLVKKDEKRKTYALYDKKQQTKVLA